MDFSFTQEQTAFRETARQFSEKELAPFAAQWDAKSVFPKDAIGKAGELGFCSLYCDEEHGGMGLSRLDAALIFEQLSRGCTSTTAFITIHNMATWMLTRFGNDATRARWAADLMSGKKLASYCLTEPGAGSDAASLGTTAKKVGDDYVLNGAKAFISGAGDTDVLVLSGSAEDFVFTQTGTEAGTITGDGTDLDILDIEFITFEDGTTYSFDQLF